MYASLRHHALSMVKCVFVEIVLIQLLQHIPAKLLVAWFIQSLLCSFAGVCYPPVCLLDLQYASTT